MSRVEFADPNVPIPLPFRDNCHCPPPDYSEQRLSVVSIVCRICYDTEKEEPLITPCRCKGTVAFVHRSCLEKWLGESNTSTCELCHQIFKTERTPKYTAGRSICRWIRISRGNARARSVKGDMLACGLLTPIAILITYICLFSSDYYNQKKFASIPAAKWTSLSLLFMIAIMLIGYYLWVYSVIRLHARMWYNWWQRECTVKYVPPSNINISTECPSNPRTPNNTPLSGAASAMPGPHESCTDRTESQFRIECEERELRHETLDKVPKQKRSALTSSAELGRPEIGEPNLRKLECPISIIKNEGVVYILNITEPPDIEKMASSTILSQACLDTPSSCSDDSTIIDIHSPRSDDLQNNASPNSVALDMNTDSPDMFTKSSIMGEPSFISAISRIDSSFSGNEENSLDYESVSDESERETCF